MASKNDASVSLNANAAVNVDAKKSQSLIVILGIISGLLCCIGSFLIYADKSLFWFPFLAAAITLIAAIFLAVLTHRNTDLAGAHPTVIEFSAAGVVKFVADPRIDVASKGLVPLVTVLGNIHSLPQASGIVDKYLNPIPNTEQEAIAKVDAINVAAQQACSDALNSLTPLPVTDALSAPVVEFLESEVSKLIPQEYTPSP
ncbi:hypothetical protein ACQKEC_14355 [Serratia marcescens]|uniref:hypothetical protein n=1 Tax=Serratia marcescens TaxID=615 RepID=UPI003CFD16AF